MNSMAWLVRAGRNAQILDDFLEKNIVAIGWKKLGDLIVFKDKKELLNTIKEGWPSWKPGKPSISASQLYRFVHDLRTGDRVLTYDPQRRVYHVGRISGDYQYNPDLIEDNSHIHPVAWEKEIERDVLSSAAKNSLGAISTLFKVPEIVAQEIESILIGQAKPIMPSEEETESDEWLLEDVETKALEFIKDRVSRLDW